MAAHYYIAVFPDGEIATRATDIPYTVAMRVRWTPLHTHCYTTWSKSEKVARRRRAGGDAVNDIVPVRRIDRRVYQELRGTVGHLARQAVLASRGIEL